MQTTEEIEALFDYSDPPTQEYLLELIPTNNRSRIGQLLPNPVADEPNEFETPEWEEDFESKVSALRDEFKQTMPEELYVELFGSLESKCHLLLDKGTKATAESFYELEQYILDHGDIFLYNQEFRYKDVDPVTGKVIGYPKTYNALTGFRCFVVDIDYVDASNIQSVIDMIKSRKILPNYINLTGNGLHLYFLFDALHDMKHSSWLMAFINGTSIGSERDVYVTIKQRMISWFKDSTAESDVRNHLAQPSRLPGSKTKNRNKRTILFKVTDVKHSIQHIAELTGIELPDKESIHQWKRKIARDQRRRAKTPKDAASKPASLHDLFDSDEPESALTAPAVDDEVNVASHDVDNPNSKYRFSFDGLAQRILVDGDWEKGSLEDLILEEQMRLWAEKKARAASPEAHMRKIAQRRGLESQYNQFKQQMFSGAMYGNRADLLHVFWNRAPLYQKDMDIISRDFYELVDHCNQLSRDKITDKQIMNIISGPHYDYSDEAIYNRIGITISMTNKKTDERQRLRDENKEKWKRILMICESELQTNPKLSDRQLSKIINVYGISVTHKTISTRLEIKELRARLLMK